MKKMKRFLYLLIGVVLPVSLFAQTVSGRFDG